MSKIIKYSNIVLDEENVVNIDVPSYDDIKILKFDEELEDEVIYGDEFEEEEFEEFEDDGSGDAPERKHRGFPESEELWDEEKGSDEMAQDVLADAYSKAEEIIIQAKREADDILYDTEELAFKRAEEIKENARKEGYDEGFKQAMSEIQPLKEEAKAELSAAKEECKRMLSDVEPQVINLTYNIIEKILNDSKFINKDIIKCIVKNGLSYTKIMGEVFVHVSPEDYEVALKNKDEIYSVAESNASIEIIRDKELNAGDCLIETPFGNIQCGIDQQLKELKSSLFYILENG